MAWKAKGEKEELGYRVKKKGASDQKKHKEGNVRAARRTSPPGNPLFRTFPGDHDPGKSPFSHFPKGTAPWLPPGNFLTQSTSCHSPSCFALVSWGVFANGMVNQPARCFAARLLDHSILSQGTASPTFPSPTMSLADESCLPRLLLQSFQGNS